MTLRDLLAAATPRPWAVMCEPDREAWIFGEGPGTGYVTPRPDPWDGRQAEGMSDQDAALIVALVNQADQLLDVVEAARTVAANHSALTSRSEMESLRDALARLDATKEQT